MPSSKLGKHTPHSAPREAARYRPVGHATRIAMPSALQAVRPVCRVGMSPLSRQRIPPTTHDHTPGAFQVAYRYTEAHFRGTPRRSAELSPRFRSGNPRCWISGPSPKSTLRRKTQLHPRRLHNGLLAQSRRRDVTPPNRSAKWKTPFLSPRGSPQGMLPHDTPRCFNCISVAYVNRDALRTPPLTPHIARAISAAAFPQQTPLPSSNRHSVRQPCSPRAPLIAIECSDRAASLALGEPKLGPLGGLFGTPRKASFFVARAHHVTYHAITCFEPA